MIANSPPQNYRQTPVSDEGAASWQREHKKHEKILWFYIALLIAGMLVCILWKRMVITISAGHHGVIFHRFQAGTATDQTFPEGIYLIAPWDVLTSYETRLQSRSVELTVPSEEGLEMKISVALRFRPYRESLGYLHRDIGPEYFDRLILPEVHGHLRRILGKRPAHDIYTGAQNILQEVAHVPVLGRLTGAQDDPAHPGSGAVRAPYVLLEELRVLDIIRPASVADAVNEKQRQEQLSLEYAHRLQREQKEADRKRVEAAGLRDFREISGTDPLRWRSVEATLELARSNNAKVVVVGSGQGAVPMMLNLGESTPAAAGSQGPARAAEPTPAGENTAKPERAPSAAAKPAGSSPKP